LDLILKQLSTALFALLILLFTGSNALAQAAMCRIPDQIAEPAPETAPPGEVNAIKPTANLLALSWSPQFCKSRGNDPEQSTQCGGASGKFGFILHGLWPDVAGRGDPAWCAPAKPLSRALIRKHFCMSPSVKLLNHEWAKHGTCASDDPEKYFKAASLLFGALKFPDMMMLSRRRITVSTFTAMFAGLNPGLRPDMIAVDTTRDGWLSGIKLCLNTNLRPQRCAREDRGTNPSRALRIWRGEVAPSFFGRPNSSQGAK
jgi:ribonuclease T2